MIKNYLKTAWRTLLRHKTFTAINVIGLTVGIVSCLLIFLVVQYETSFDTFHHKKDHIYRVLTVGLGPTTSYQSGVPFPTADALKLDFKQLKGVASILRNEGNIFSIGTNKFKEEEAYYADPDFFSMFDFDWLAGDKKTALAEPNTIVLTERDANKFFGDWHKAMGQTIRYNNHTDWKVTGIIKDPPPNTDFPLQIVMSYVSMKTKGGEYYGNRNDWITVLGENYNFVELPEGADTKIFYQQLAAFAKRHIPEPYASRESMTLQPLTAMHYDSGIDIFTYHPFSKNLIKAIGLIGLFLLIIACINFINLSTAQAVRRSKEVGVRKVLGSSRNQLIFQFIGETFIITAIALALAIIVGKAVLPLLDQLLQVHLDTWFFLRPSVLAFLALVLIVVSGLSGLYPALVLSGFKPYTALKNKISAAGTKGISLRRGLVILQFGIAQTLIIGTLVVVSQLNFFKNKPLGYTKDAVVTTPIPGDSVSRSKISDLRAELLRQPGIESVSFSFGSPSDETAWFSGIHYNHSTKETDWGADLKWADTGYFNLYHLEFVAGAPYPSADTVRGYVVNETLIKKLGISNPQEAIGKTIGLWDNHHFEAPITGVVKDYNTGSLKEEIPPVLMTTRKESYRLMSVKVNPQNLSTALAAIKANWNTAFPESLYEYSFVDDQLAHFYKSDTQLSLLYQIFAGIAILISCLGLFGLVSFMTVQRTKEIGIRKTLGASLGHIVYLFSKEFIVLILIAFAIAVPLGWYLMNQWLQAYAYRITLGPGIFLLTILLSLLIAGLTIAYKAIQAAMVSPVKSLKTE